ncbi:MAG: GNAT family N-acetyltransferase [Bacteroidetes bacterium]|nr:GNAT family N-acetyltransferase [Bacteroidota bacterium]
MGYEIAKSVVSSENINAYSRLLSKVFVKTTKFTPEFLHWQYAQNPVGTIVGTDAFLDGELIAHHATIPVVYNVFGEVLKGVLALNNVTHPDHQGKGLFTELGKATFEEARRLKYQFVITVTNQNSTKGYLNKFGFNQISQLEVKLGIGTIIPGISSNHQVYSKWDDESLSWRLRNPEAKYYRDKLTILAKTDIPGIFAQMQNCQETLLYKTGLTSKKSPFKLWIGLVNTKQINGLFVAMPEKLKPSPLNLLFKDLSGDIPPFLKDNLFFELIDFDAF